MRQWPWIALAVAVVALAALIYPLVQTQKRLTLVQSELGRANEQVVQARAGATELERVVANLKTELDAATMARRELQGNLEEANSDVEHMRMEFDAAQAELEKAKQAAGQANEELANARKELEAASAEVNRLTADRDTGQSQLSEKQSQLEARAAELAMAKEATVQANAKVTELEETAANIAKDAEAERDKLQVALDQANSEVDRLKTELQQEKGVPPPNGDSTSDSPESESGLGRQ